MEEQAPDQWPARSGVALALAQVAPLLPEDELGTLFAFFVPKALGDRCAEVRSHMREAALAAINAHGKVRRLLSYVNKDHMWLFSMLLFFCVNS